MAESGWLTVDGGRLYYEVAGQGHPLTLIHAGVANLRQWDAQPPAFADRYRVVRYDTRGFGRTTTDDVPFSNRADLAALLDHLGIASTYLLGNSRGGTIAIDFTLERPERVDALISVAAGISGWDVEPTPEEAAIWAEYEQRWEAKDWDWIVETETALWADGPGQPPTRLPAALRQQMRAWIADVYRDHASEDPTAQPLDPPGRPAAGRDQRPNPGHRWRPRHERNAGRLRTLGGRNPRRAHRGLRGRGAHGQRGAARPPQPTRARLPVGGPSGERSTPRLTN